MELTIECQKREAGSKPNALRRSGLIPAVLYGHNGTESIPLTVKAKTVETMLKKAVVNNTLITLEIPDISWNGTTLLREVQKHPWKNNTYHLSFFAVSPEDTIEANVPLHLVGESKGVKVGGGVLEPVMTEFTVQCRSNNIPDAIEVDVSELEIGEYLLVSQIILPEGVTTTLEPEQPVVAVMAPRVIADATEEVEASA